MNREQAELAFSEWLSAEGFGEHQIPADAEWHNIALPDNRNGKKTGSAKLVFGDRIEGVFKDFRSGAPIVWHPGNGAAANFTDEERQAWAAENERKAHEKKEAQEAARKRAMTLYRESPAATPDHPYLAKKGITKNLHQLKVDGEDLLVPVYNARTDEFQTIQRIKPDGTKLFPKDGVKAGGYAMYGSYRTISEAAKHKSNSPMVVCEGYATAWAIYVSTFYWVVAALDCGNLKVVADELHNRFPMRRLIFAADNDFDPDRPDHNPGVKAATKAAREVKGHDIKIAVPPPGDFWDLWQAEGDAAVKKAISEAVDPPREEEPAPEEGAPPSPPDDGISDELQITDLNETYGLVKVGDKVVVMDTSGTSGNELSFMTVSAFELWYANRYVTLRNEKKMPLGKYWLHHRHRRQYSGLVFSPDREVQGHYNLWRGFAVKPKCGDCSKFLAHIRDNVCSGIEEHYRWVIGWFADIIQHPNQKIGTSLVLRGKQGTGKTIVGKIIGSLLGTHYVPVSDPRLITGRFNSHLISCLLLHADEGFWAGDRTAEGKLKDLITGDYHYVEFKGKEPIKVRNYVRMLVSGNPDWIVPAGHEERRFAVIDVGEAKMQDHKYFAAIEAEANNGGREALLEHLLLFDLKSIDLRKIPLTAALLDQKISSLTTEAAWWFDVLASGELPRGCGEPRYCPVKVLFDKYIRHAAKQGARRKSIETQLGIFLNKHVPGLHKLERRPYKYYWRGCSEDREGRIYEFPPLVDCRAAFAEKMKQEVVWDDQTEWVKVKEEEDDWSL
jgi:phage/plasmid primase-like uncharacterized protein